MTLTAAGSERKFDLHALPAPALLIFHGDNNTDTVAEANVVIRADFPGADQLLIASVIDLHHIPRMFRPMAVRAMKKAYERSGELIPAELDAEAYVILLPDWDGSLAKFVGFEGVGEVPGIAVVDRAGRLHGAFQGDGAIEQALATVREVAD